MTTKTKTTVDARPDTPSEVDRPRTLTPAELAGAAFANPGQYAAAVFDEGPLERDKLLLVGVPHIVTRVAYHSDFKFPKGYVTIHGFIAPQEYLTEAVNRGWVPDVTDVDQLLFRAGDSIKYNDGSTGLRRQATMIFHNLGVIDVGEVVDNSSFDRSWDEWAAFSQTSQENAKNGIDKIDVPDITLDNAGNPLVLLVRHGLRASFMKEFGTNVFYFS